MKNFSLVVILLIAVSCGPNNDHTKFETQEDAKTDYQPNPKSIELNNKALEITTFNFDDSIKVDSAIMLLDQATALDSLYFLGYVNKIMFLMMKNDFSRSLETNQRIRELRPKQPKWIIQSALIFELLGDLDKANTEYRKGIKAYENMLDSETNLSWELELEFAQSLVLANDFDRAQDIINKLKKENPDLEFWEAFELQTKNELLTLMNGKRP
ncbi:MAG: hypothetical protein AAFX87_27180 [Bacteroidota bacterium]